jgi:hypothetical protein
MFRYLSNSPLEVARRWREAEDELERERAALQRQRTELETKNARLQALVRDAAMQQVAEGIRARHRIVSISGRERRDLVRVRIEHVVWLGSDAFVVFSVQNRRPTPFRVGRVVLQAGGLERTDAISFARPEGVGWRGIVGIVAPGTRQSGVIVLRDAVSWLGESVALQVLEDQEEEAAVPLPIILPFLLRE